ncbi:MAG: hypothetical protein Q8N59_00465 [bacterium]|nr:hypothetical protein [bacterium]
MDQNTTPKNNFEIKEMNIRSDSPQTKPPKRKMRGLVNLFSKKNFPKTLIVIFVIAAALATFSFIVGKNSFNLDNIKINIRIPSSVSSGEEVVVKIDYINDNRVGLKDVYLTIDYPSGTFSIDGKELNQERKSLGSIAKKSQGAEEFRVRLVGEKGDSKTIVAKLEFMPQNINSRFENSTTSRIEINSVLVSINIEGPEKSIAGQEANYLIEYENKTEENIYNLRLELTYDKDFKFKSAEPVPQKETNNLWQVDVLKAGEKRSINLIGNLDGKEGESKSLKVVIGKIENEQLIQYSQLEYLTLVSPSPLLLNLVLEGMGEDCKIDPGQSLKYRIDFKNNTDVPLRELILKTYFKDSIFNLRGIQLMGIGFFDSRENIITWSGADVPALKLLEPNQSGTVSFSISIKKPVPMNNYNDKNVEAEVSAEIGTKTVPAKFAVSELKISNDLSCKVNSEVDLKAKVYYYEPSVGIINSGPMPPRVDALTNFTVHWQILNGSNDLENVIIRSTLPQGVYWSDVYINKVSNSNVYYNERTNDIVWQFDEKIPAGVGFLLPAYELVFQIGIRPSTNQIGTAPILINEAYLEAKDSFTGILFTDYTNQVNTNTPDDSKDPGGIVRE